ncbi:MAG: ISNCY family transposase [Deltaproteobacteria bacterium]|nr:ISNCY family transposase [Deltaproteobacteria bacterium]
MRKKWDEQLNIFHILPRNKVARELQGISEIIEANPQVVETVFQDLSGSCLLDTGRNGMTAEQILRCAILKQYRNLTYEELAFHLQDSQSFRAFAKMKMGQYPGSSTLQENIKEISAKSWEAIHLAIVGYAEAQGIERGRVTRMDSTVVETHVHFPTDSSLLQDGIRIITRWLGEGKSLQPMPGYSFSDHTRRAKKWVMTIMNTRKEAIREKAYRDLLGLAGRVQGYALGAIPILYGFVSEDAQECLQAYALAEKLERAVSLLDRVMDQAKRRVLQGEQVPSSEKVVSFFECHTDIIVKDRRDTFYGHKIFLTGGQTGLILDCVVERGNPADTALFPVLVERQERLYGRPPRQVAADGGFASQENLACGKGRGIQDVAFAKKRGLSVLEMVKSQWVYEKLRNFRAGIEASISWLKRSFGLGFCTWRGWAGFKQYLWSEIVSYNLLILSRLKMAAV